MHTHRKRDTERGIKIEIGAEIYVPRFYIILLFLPKENKLVYGDAKILRHFCVVRMLW